MDFIWNYGTNNHETALTAIAQAAVSFAVICPFVREEQALLLLDYVDPAQLRVLTLWNWRFFLTGTTQLGALACLIKAGSEVRAVRSGLHAKVYIADDSAALITSANLTRGGLRENLECGLVVVAPHVLPLLRQFETEWRRATPLTEEQVEAALSALQGLQPQWDDLTEELLRLEELASANIPIPAAVWTHSTDSVAVELTADQLEFLSRPIHGQGGYQSLLRRLQDNIHGRLLTLSRTDCERIVRYATQYGEGGFQGRLRTIIQLARIFSN